MPPEAGDTVLAADPRFRYAWTAAPSGRPDRPLLVSVHGSERDHLAARDAFAPLVRRLDLSVLAPHFPAGAVDPAVAEGYKFLREPGMDYAWLLEAMLDDFAAVHPFDRRRVALFGFSGGAQFAHRYALVAATRLCGLVAAAPGNVTLLDDALPWWAGTGDMAARVGRPLDREGLARLNVHLLVGEDDREQGLVVRGPDDPYHSPHADLAGATRPERLVALHASLKAQGVTATFEVVAGAGHTLAPLAAAAANHLEGLLG